MLILNVGEQEHYDEESNIFFTKSYCTLRLEHSLASVSKWESKFKVPFFSPREETPEQIAYYVTCMVLDENPPADFLEKLNGDNFLAVREYLEDEQTATTFDELPSGKEKKPRKKETITSELIYYWMSSFGIDWEAQHWNINRLFTLIRIFGEKNAPEEELNPEEQAMRYRDLNEKRKQELGTRG